MAEMGVSEREPHEEWDKPCSSPGRRGMTGLQAGLERFAWRADETIPEVFLLERLHAAGGMSEHKRMGASLIRGGKIAAFGSFAWLLDIAQVGYP